MNFCQKLETEANCAPFTTAHGPSTPCCDKYMNKQCGVFNELYATKNPYRSCFNEQVGKQYICPQVSPGGIAPQPLGSWFDSQQCNKVPMTCHHQNPNIGVNELCPYRYQSQQQPPQQPSPPQLPQQPPQSQQQTGAGCGGCGPTSTLYCRESYGPDYFNLAALGLQGEAYRPNGNSVNNMGMGITMNGGAESDVEISNDVINGTISTDSCKNVPQNKPYTCQISQCTTRGGCPAFDPTCRPNNSAVYQYVCGNSTRCGNGDLGQQQGCGCDCTQVLPKIWDQPVNPYRTYGLTQPEEVPGYYLDVSQPPIGNRPVNVQSDRETIPSMLLCNKTNLPGRCFDCKQPCWNKKCI